MDTQEPATQTGFLRPGTAFWLTVILPVISCSTGAGQAFIHVLDSNRSLLAVVAAITNLADNLGIKTVAEGIESEDIIGALQSIDCTWGQGYYFVKPMTAIDAEAYILGLGESQRSA